MPTCQGTTQLYRAFIRKHGEPRSATGSWMNVWTMCLSSHSPGAGVRASAETERSASSLQQLPACFCPHRTQRGSAENPEATPAGQVEGRPPPSSCWPPPAGQEPRVEVQARVPTLQSGLRPAQFLIRSMWTVGVPASLWGLQAWRAPCPALLPTDTQQTRLFLHHLQSMRASAPWVVGFSTLTDCCNHRISIMPRRNAIPVSHRPDPAPATTTCFVPLGTGCHTGTTGACTHRAQS